MKRIYTILGSLLFWGLQAQTIKNMRGDTVTIVSEKDSLVITSEKEIKADTTRIRLGNKGITIIEKDGKTTVDIKSVDEHDKNYTKEIDKEGVDKKYEGFKDKNKKGKHTPKNHPHWDGFGFGFNGFTTQDQKFNMPDSMRYLDLKNGNSYNYSINFGENSLKILPFMLLVSGIGFDFSYYRFEHNNNVQEINGTIVEKPAHTNAAYGKSRLFASYLNMPLMIEFKIPFNEHPVHISGGVMGSIKMWSSSKEVYYINGDKQKEKFYNNFNIGLFRYGYRAQVGYNNFSIYANYYPVSLFNGTNDPTVFPFSVGILLQDN